MSGFTSTTSRSTDMKQIFKYFNIGAMRRSSWNGVRISGISVLHRVSAVSSLSVPVEKHGANVLRA